jgi:hypothetical protein
MASFRRLPSGSHQRQILCAGMRVMTRSCAGKTDAAAFALALAGDSEPRASSSARRRPSGHSATAAAYLGHSTGEGLQHGQPCRLVVRAIRRPLPSRQPDRGTWRSSQSRAVEHRQRFFRQGRDARVQRQDCLSNRFWAIVTHSPPRGRMADHPPCAAQHSLPHARPADQHKIKRAP